jgi:hypothetical protein
MEVGSYMLTLYNNKRLHQFTLQGVFTSWWAGRDWTG